MSPFRAPTAAGTAGRGAEVQVFDLWSVVGEHEQMMTVLSGDERYRAAAISSSTRRHQFVSTRAAARVRLGQVLGISPDRVVLRQGAHGKPELAGDLENSCWFSISHRDRLGVIALCRTVAVGVDIQRVAPERPWERLLGKICHPTELPEAKREALRLSEVAFFERWVAKEAVLKAIGCGLSVSMADVRLHRGSDDLLVPSELPRWPIVIDACELTSLVVPAGFVGALAFVRCSRPPCEVGPAAQTLR